MKKLPQRSPSAIKALLVCASLLAASPLCAEAFDPALAALKAKYQSEVQTANKARDTAVETGRQPYLRALDALEAKVTAAGNTPALKAVLDEKQAVTSGDALSPVPPAVLPREITALRTAYLRAHAITGQATALRLQQLQSGFLRELGAFETRARASQNTALLDQVTTEKLALAGEKPITFATAAIPKGKNAVLNGDFSQTGPDGKPAGWSGISSTASIQTENANQFLRYTTEKPSTWNPVATQKFPIPANARKVELSAKLRAKDLQMAPAPGDNSGITILAEIRAQNGTIIGRSGVSLHHIEKNWVRRESSVTLPKGAYSMSLTILFGSATGTIDVDAIEMDFK